jgi:hypothetical protein
MYVYMYTCMYVCVCVCVCVWLCVCIYKHIYGNRGKAIERLRSNREADLDWFVAFALRSSTQVSAIYSLCYIHTHIHKHTCICIHTYTHTHTHIHIHTYTHKCRYIDISSSPLVSLPPPCLRYIMYI